MLASISLLACGDDESVADAAVGTGGGGAAAEGGSGGRAGGGGGGRSGAGTGGSAGMMMMAMCSEPPPSAPVVCGGQTCTPPTFMNNMCVYACCAQLGGKEVCGAKSTNPMFPTQCEPAATPDPSCPDVDAMGMPLEGCCNAAQGKCGIISTVRPGCITQSMLIMLPDPPQACTPAGSDDAGTPDAGL